jgi:hypothetical protein
MGVELWNERAMTLARVLTTPEGWNDPWACDLRVGKTSDAEENDMKTAELQRILGYVNIGLAIAHDSGVSIGHFGCGDFIELAQTVNGMLLHSIAPAVVIGSGGADELRVNMAPADTAIAV